MGIAGNHSVRVVFSVEDEFTDDQAALVEATLEELGAHVVFFGLDGGRTIVGTVMHEADSHEDAILRVAEAVHQFLGASLSLFPLVYVEASFTVSIVSAGEVTIPKRRPAPTLASVRRRAERRTEAQAPRELDIAAALNEAREAVDTALD